MPAVEEIESHLVDLNDMSLEESGWLAEIHLLAASELLLWEIDQPSSSLAGYNS